MAPTGEPATGYAGPSLRSMTWQVVSHAADCSSDARSGQSTAAAGRMLAEIDCGRTLLVKQSAERAIYRVDLPSTSLYLKYHRARSWLSLVRRWFRGSPSRRECRKAVELARRGIPTIEAVAVGERRASGIVREDCLVTTAIVGHGSLAHYVDVVLPTLAVAEARRQRRRIASELAALVAAAHRAGIWHDDLHAGNILVQSDARAAAGDAANDDAANDDAVDDDATDDARDGGAARDGSFGRRAMPAASAPDLRLYLIDVEGVRFLRTLARDASLRSLAVLLADWRARTTLADRVRFWRAYRRARPDVELGAPDRAAAEIAIRARRHAWHVCRSRDKRCLATNRDFYRILARHGRLHAIRELPVDEARRFLERGEQMLGDCLDRPLKLSHSSIVVEAEIRLDERRVRVALKRTQPRTWWKRVFDLVRASRGERAWRWGHALLARGIATPRPIFMARHRTGVLAHRSYLATEWIDGAADLHHYAWRLAKRDADERRRRTRQAAESLGRLAGRMHAWRITHRDLKACNVVFVERADRVDALLVDLDGLRMSWRLSKREQAKNLARLATSLELHKWIARTDRLRFLRAYLSELGENESEWRALWRRAAPWVDRHIRRLSRPGRHVA